MDESRRARLSLACSMAGIPLTECARRLGVTRSALYEWARRGDPDLTADSHHHRAARSPARVGDDGPLTGARIAEVLGCPVEALEPGGPLPTWSGEQTGEADGSPCYVPPVRVGQLVVVVDRGEAFLCEPDAARGRWVCADAGRYYEPGDAVDGVQSVGKPAVPPTTRVAMVTQDAGVCGGAVLFAGVPLDVLAGPVLSAGADPGPEVEAFDLDGDEAGLVVDALRLLEALAGDREQRALRAVFAELGLATDPAGIDSDATLADALDAIRSLQAHAVATVDSVEAGDALLDALDAGLALVDRLADAHATGDTDAALAALDKLTTWADAARKVER